MKKRGIITTSITVGVLSVVIATTAYAANASRGQMTCPNCGSKIEMKAQWGGQRGQMAAMTLEDLKAKLAEKVESGEITQEEADKRIAAREEREANRPAPMTLEEFKAKLAEKVESGEITQEEADKRIAAREERETNRPAPMTFEEFKAKLAEKVESGEITQEEADKRIAACEEREANRAEKLEEFKAKLAQEVADGKITQEQADKILNGDFKGRRPMGRGRNNISTTTETTTESQS